MEDYSSPAVLAKRLGDANSGHQCYVHTIQHNLPRAVRLDQLRTLGDYDKAAYYYVGITGRNWLHRLIPGGFKGARFLRERRITDRVNITLEERERAIEEYVRHNPRKGIPNPFISELSKDDHYYLRVIEARPKTLSPNQVRQIRELAAHKPRGHAAKGNAQR